MARPFLGDTSFRTQTALVFGTIVLALTVALSVVMGRLLSTELLSDVGLSLEVVANNAQRALADGLRQRLGIVRGLAASTTLWRNGLDSAEVRSALAQQQETSEHLAWLGVADARGVVRAATGGLLLGVDVSARPWFAAGLRGDHIGDVHNALLLARLLPADSLGEPQRFVDFSVPIVVDGERKGVLALHGGWDWTRTVIETLLPDDAATRGMQLFIVDHDGVAIYAPEGTNKATPKVGDALSTVVDAARSDTIVRWPDHADYLTASVRLQPKEPTADLGWQVVARIPKDIAYAPVRAAVTRVAIAGIVAALIAIVVAWFASRSISGPMSAIARAAVDVQNGMPGARIPRFEGNLELRHLSGALIGMTEDFESRVHDRTRQLEDANAELARWASRDPLTGLLNRRGFDEQMKTAVASAQRRSAPIHAIAIDIDHFKKVNDVHGHATGDMVLKSLAAIFTARFRDSDIVARMGGEEFMVLLTDTDLAGAYKVADDLVRLVASTTFPGVPELTISCGVSKLLRADDDVQGLGRADRALYQAKAAGRNRVAMFETMV